MGPLLSHLLCYSNETAVGRDAKGGDPESLGGHRNEVHLPSVGSVPGVKKRKSERVRKLWGRTVFIRLGLISHSTPVEAAVRVNLHYGRGSCGKDMDTLINKVHGRPHASGQTEDVLAFQATRVSHGVGQVGRGCVKV